jgi:hypothetical protein
MSVKANLLNMNWWQSCGLILCITVMLFAGGWAARQGLEVNVDVSFAGRLEELENNLWPEVNSTVSALVHQSDYVVTVYRAANATEIYLLWNGTTGKIDLYSQNKTSIQQGAIGNLTSGGSIYLKGNTFDTTLSYTSNILIIEDYVGRLNFIGQNALYYNGQNRTDIIANPVESASYVISLQGSTILLKNCTTGQIDYRSTTDVGAVVNNAFGNLTYGLVHVRAGVYPQLTHINAKGRVTLEGDGMYSTQFFLGNSVNDDMIRWAPAATEQFFELKDICLAGNKAQNTLGMGLNFTGNTYDFTAYRVWIYDVALDGFYVKNSAWGMRCFGLTIETCGRNGLNMSDNSNAASFFGSRFASNAGSGVDLGTNSWAKWFFVCEFDSNTGKGLMIRGGSSHQVIGGRITSNLDDGAEVWGNNHYFEGTYIASNTGYGIDIHGTTSQVQYCQFASNVAGQINPGGTTMVIHYNLGYVTEKDGSATNVTATTFSFLHGLVAAPSAGHGGVWCSFNTISVSAYTWTANATAITVTVAGTGLPATITCYWKAEYLP